MRSASAAGGGFPSGLHGWLSAAGQGAATARLAQTVIKDAKYPTPASAPTASSTGLAQAFLGKRTRSGITPAAPLQTPLTTAPSATVPTSRTADSKGPVGSFPTTSLPPQSLPSVPSTPAAVPSSSNGFNPYQFRPPQLAKWAASQLGGARAAGAAFRGLSVDDTGHVHRRSGPDDPRDVASDGDASDGSDVDSADDAASVASEKYDAAVASLGAIADALGAIARVVLVAFPAAAASAAASLDAELAQQAAPPGSGSAVTPSVPSVLPPPPPVNSHTSTPMDTSADRS